VNRIISVTTPVLVLAAACAREPKGQAAHHPSTPPAAGVCLRASAVTHRTSVPVRHAWPLADGDSLVVRTCPQTDTTYLLLIVHAPPHHLFRACPPILESINDMENVALVEDTSMNLDGFSQRTAPNDSVVGEYTGPLLTTAGDGAGELWICYEGHWAVAMVD